MNTERLRKDDTPEGKAIWDKVDQAAARAPRWVKEKLMSTERPDHERRIASLRLGIENAIGLIERARTPGAAVVELRARLRDDKDGTPHDQRGDRAAHTAAVLAELRESRDEALGSDDQACRNYGHFLDIAIAEAERRVAAREEE